MIWSGKNAKRVRIEYRLASCRTVGSSIAESIRFFIAYICFRVYFLFQSLEESKINNQNERTRQRLKNKIMKSFFFSRMWYNQMNERINRLTIMVLMNDQFHLSFRVLLRFNYPVRCVLRKLSAMPAVATSRAAPRTVGLEENVRSDRFDSILLLVDKCRLEFSLSLFKCCTRLSIQSMNFNQEKTSDKRNKTE